MARDAENLPAPRRYRHGIRYQIASLLLLSTLNGVALLAATIFLFSSIRFHSTDTNLVLRDVFRQIEAVHQNMVDLALAPGDDEDLTLDAELDKLAERLDRIGPSTETARSKLTLFQESTQDWRIYVSERLEEIGPPHAQDPVDTPPAAETATEAQHGGSGLFDWLDERGEQLYFQMEGNERILLAELALVAETNRPQWVDQAMRWAPWMMAWVLAVSLMTLLMAFRVKNVLSTPLEKLIAVTSEVSQGNLSVKIPELAPWRGAPEILALSRSVATMRDRLVHSIGESERRRDEIVTVLNSLKDGVMVLDRQDRVLDLNPQAVGMMMEKKPGAIPKVGLTFSEIFPKLNALEVDVEQDLDFVNQSGKARYFTVRLANIRNRGKGTAGARIAVIRDITQDHEVESLKREFLSVVTHELKTPLTAIEGYNKLLLMGKGGGLSGKQRIYAQTIADQTQALKTMIQNLLDATRLEGNTLPMEIRETGANQLMEDCAQSFGAAAQTKSITLKTELQLPTDQTLEVDPFRFKQVVGNLISNALKFTPEGGIITLGSQRNGDILRFTVKDTGRGIPEESLHLLFDKFYQVAKGDTRIQGGAGLGLYICRQLVESQGGHISVRSQLGEGSEFTLSFRA